MILPVRSLGPLWAFALILPTPAAALRVVEIRLCGNGSQSLVLPVGRAPLPADGYGCCRKACHAAQDRRKKSRLLPEGCC